MMFFQHIISLAVRAGGLGKGLSRFLPQTVRREWKRICSSPIGARLVKGTLWSVAGAAITKLLGLLSSIVVALMLDTTAFGEFGMIQGTAGLFGTFAGLGIGITATRYVAELRHTNPRRCGRVIGLSLAVAAAGGVLSGMALVVFSPWLAAHSLAAPKLAPLLQCSCALVIFGALQGAYLGALSGFEAFRQVARTSFLGSVLGFPLLILATWMGGLQGAIWGSAAQLAICCAAAHLALVREARNSKIRLSFKLSTEEGGVLWRFALPAFLAGMLVTPANWAAKAILANQDSGYAEIALVSAANQWMNFVTFLPWMMGGVLVPIFSSLHATGCHAEFTKLLRRNLLLNAAVSLGLAIPMCLAASALLRCYGPDYTVGVPVFVITMLTAVIVAVNNLMSRAIQATGQAWADLLFNGLWAIVALGANALLIPQYKAVGHVAAQALAAAVLAIGQWILFSRLMRRARKACGAPQDRDHSAASDIHPLPQTPTGIS